MKNSFKKKHIVVLLTPLFFCSYNAIAACTVSGTTLTTNDTLYYCSGVGSYDKIIVNTTSNYSLSPLTGFGVYQNNQTDTIKELDVTTSGSGADGLRFNGSSNLTIGDNLKILTTGSSADGINLAITSKSTLTIGNNAYIQAAGIGVRANLSKAGGNNSIKIGDYLTVVTSGSGDNFIEGGGYAVYAGNRDAETESLPNANSAFISIGDHSFLSTSGSSAYAVYANKTGNISLGSTNIKTTGAGAHGLYSKNGDVTPNYGFSCIFGSCPKTSFDGGVIKLSGDTIITVNTANDGTANQSYAIYSSGVKSLIESDASSTTFNSNTYKITGDIKADTGGTIDLTMNNGSLFNGNSTLSDLNSYIDLNIIGTASQWNMTKSSSASILNLDSSTVSLGNQSVILDGTNDVVLTLNELSGQGTFNLRTTVDGINNYHDLIEVLDTNKASGNHKITVNDSNTGAATVDGSERVQVVKTEGGSAAFTGDTDVGAYTYNVRQGETAFGERTTDWYLTSTGKKTSTGDNSANIASINYLMNYIEMQTLLQRMGELRETTNEGGDVWGRIYSGVVNSFENQNLSGKKLRYNGFQLGIDKNVDSTEQWDVYVGLLAGMSKGKTDFQVGSGDTTSYYAGVYGTYKEYDGFYLDFVAKYMYLDNKLNTTTTGGYGVNGSGSSDGYTVSLEAGKRFWRHEKPTAESGSWFIEPQAQITYGHQSGATISSSNGLKTKLSDFESVLGRVSALIGYSTYAQDNDKVDVYAKLGFVSEFNGDTSYQFNNGAKEYYSFRGRWFDMGLGVNAQISESHNLYADLNYRTGSTFNMSQINVGYRYNF